MPDNRVRVIVIRLVPRPRRYSRLWWLGVTRTVLGWGILLGIIAWSIDLFFFTAPGPW